jgi:mannose-6-phosphate isomerase-like protein (cupin superfamily)
MTTESSLFVAPGSGARLGPGITWKVSGVATHGSVSLFEGTLPPGVVVPPHLHEREDECTHVLEGELVFRVGEREFAASAGAHVVKPRGVHHAFWNVGSSPARVLEIIAPATLDGYFCELTGLQACVDMDDLERRAATDALQARYGIRTDWSAARELFERVRLGPS